MSDNFLTIEGGKPINNFSNKWRNIVFIIVLCSLVGGGVFGYIQFKPDEPKTVLQKLSAVLSHETDPVPTYGEGGDIAPPHTEVVAPVLPELIGTLPQPDAFTAETIFVKDHTDGVVLYVKNGYGKRPMASITKLMTALVLLEHNLDATIPRAIVHDDLADSHVYPDETYTVDQLWNAMIVASSNKAAMTLVDATNWSRIAFIERMNQKAVELGMVDTYFVEPTGLDERNVSTGSDLAILLNEAMKHEEITETMLKKETILRTANTQSERHVWNTNWLLTGWVPNQFTYFGGKTGFIEAAGYNVVVRLGHADGRELDIVILGANVHEARFTEARDIAESVFTAYKWPVKQE